MEDLRSYFSVVSAEEWEVKRKEIEKKGRRGHKGKGLTTRSHRRNQSVKVRDVSPSRGALERVKSSAGASGAPTSSPPPPAAKRAGSAHSVTKRPMRAAHRIFGNTLPRTNPSNRARRESGPMSSGQTESVLNVSEPIGQVMHKVHVSNNWEWKGEGVHKSFKLLDMIGKGAYGTVHKAEHTTTCQTIAIKILPLGEEFGISESGHSDELRNELQREMDTLKKLRHENTVTYYGCVIQQHSVWLLMEFCEYGSVKYISRALGRGFTEAEIAEILLQVCRGLAYLHEESGVLHRDIKGRNVLVSSTGNVKIADFGASAPMIIKQRCATSHSDTLTTMAGLDGHHHHHHGGGDDPMGGGGVQMVGTPAFMSPEICRGAPYDTKADIWSLGILCLELAETHPPHHLLSAGEAMLVIGRGDSRRSFLAMEEWTPSFHAVVDACLSIDPVSRPSATELVRHYPFLRDAMADDCPTHVKALLKYISPVRCGPSSSSTRAPRPPLEDGGDTIHTDSLSSVDAGVIALDEEEPPDHANKRIGIHTPANTTAAATEKHVVASSAANILHHGQRKGSASNASTLPVNEIDSGELSSSGFWDVCSDDDDDDDGGGDGGDGDGRGGAIGVALEERGVKQYSGEGVDGRAVDAEVPVHIMEELMALRRSNEALKRKLEEERSKRKKEVHRLEKKHHRAMQEERRKRMALEELMRQPRGEAS